MGEHFRQSFFHLRIRWNSHKNHSLPQFKESFTRKDIYIETEFYYNK